MLPYDRTLLTKMLPTFEVNKNLLRGKDFLSGGDIDFKLGKKVNSLNNKEKSIKLDDGSVIVRQ